MNAIEDPTVRTWRELLRNYRANHDHTPCRGCDPQWVAEDHLLACYEAADAMEEPDPDEGPIHDPAYDPFCGCYTCVVREVLNAAMPALIHQLLRDHENDATGLMREALQREWL